MGLQNPLDGLGPHLEAAADDGVVRAALDPDEPVGVDPGEITGPRPGPAAPGALLGADLQGAGPADGQLGAVLAIAARSGTTWLVPASAFAGALIAVALVYRLSVVGGKRLEPRVLLLAGVVVGSFAVALVFLVGFIRWQRVAPHPMLPLKFFSDRRFSVGSAVVTTSFFIMFGFFFLFSLYLQFARGYSPLEAGLATLPMALTFIVVSPRSAALVEPPEAATTVAAFSSALRVTMSRGRICCAIRSITISPAVMQKRSRRS